MRAVRTFASAAVVTMTFTVVGAGDDSSSFKITPQRPNDTISVKADKKAALFTIHSPFGISQASIERLDKTWPDAVALRLHLAGMSRFRAAAGKLTLEAAAGAQNDKLEVRVWKDGNEDAPLDAKSPFWIEIQMFDKDGRRATAIPLKDGYFEVRLPQAFFADNPQSITLRWIDFYRN
jgi:hypothetical protein